MTICNGRRAGEDLTAVREELEVRKRAEVAELGPRPGVADLVAAAVTAGLRLAVASSSSRRWVEGHLDRIGALGAFHAVRCRDDVRQTKPAPDVYLAALEALGVNASQAVAFEDSPNGVQAAKTAGIYTVAVPNGVTRGWPFDHADRVIDSLHGVTVHGVDRWLAALRVRVAGDAGRGSRVRRAGRAPSGAAHAGQGHARPA